MTASPLLLATLPDRSRRRLAFLPACLGLASCLPRLAGATNRTAPDVESQSVILVATRILTDEVYAHTVIVVRPAGNGLHVGVILNRQTDTALSSLFPAQATSRNVTENVFFGGPMTSLAIAAVTRNEPERRDGVIEFSNDIFMVMQARTIDAIIDTAPNTARYYMGNVIWRPGELDGELERGLWNVHPLSADIVFRKNTDSLWRELDDDSHRLSASLDANAAQRRNLSIASAKAFG